MSAAIEQVQASAAAGTWAEANQAYLRAELRRLRLLFEKKVRWLRRQWQQDPLGPNQGAVISDAYADRLLAGESMESEIQFYQEDPESAEISRTLDALQADLAQRRQRLQESGGMPSVEVLARKFGLQPFERDVLLLCWSLEEDPAFPWLCAYAQDDAHARFVTPQLALSLLCANSAERDAGRLAFLAGAPLRRFRLIATVDVPATLPLSQRPLRIEERVADYIRGVNSLDESVAYLLRPVTPLPAASAHREIADGLARWAQSVPAGEPWPVFLLNGSSVSGKQTIAREFCSCLGLQLCALDVKSLPAAELDRHQMLRLLERETILSHIAIYLDVSDIDAGERALQAATRDWIERSGGLLFVGSRDRWQTSRRALHIAVPKADTAAQRALWTKSLEGVTHAVDGQVEAIVQQFDLAPEAIPQAVNSAVATAQRRAPGETAVRAEDLWQACREQVGWKLGDLARRLEPCYCWDDIVLPEDAGRQLREIADQVAARPRVYETWGFGARLPRGRGISALFTGPSGTGKTMAAEILAHHLKIDLYRIDLAGIVSKYIGETEKNLRNVFEAAEQTGAILFFDEADALFGKRSEVKDSHDRYANIEVNYLLQRMEDYRGLAILCTNRRSALDRAFLRRLRFLVEFPFPDFGHRRLIWEKVFPPQAPLGSLDFDALSRLEIPGGNIRNIALNAAFLAAGEEASIGMDHVLRAARREYAKIDKLLTEAEFGEHYRGMKR
ncbi:MAG TPA: ATP-binding protein [Candidatus Acidoferrales bacterium]|jgi:SpoVK/Ycf46/Vps4 family AAA+-type ATPase|nr:ATP-binding protein [Candidatus Acidoferrales bacterium]